MVVHQYKYMLTTQLPVLANEPEKGQTIITSTKRTNWDE